METKHRAVRRSLRWPWQPAPGMVRIGRKEYIGLLEKANRSYRLEAESAVLRAESAALDAQRRARALAAEQTTAAGLPADDLAVDELVDDPPRDGAGHLHEQAFLTLLRQRLVEHRLGELIPTTDTRGDDHR